MDPHRREPPLASRQVLAELPVRVTTFLFAAGTHGGVRAELARGGFGPADHAEGFALLAAVCAYDDTLLDPHVDAPARDAAAELEAWWGRHAPRFRAALRRHHPDVTLFHGLDAPAGVEALRATGVLLGALDELAAREHDPRAKGVLQLLARRGLDARERARLRGRLDLAARIGGSVAGASTTTIRAHRQRELHALYLWYRDWAATARALVLRRDYLIALGLARPRTAEGAGVSGEAGTLRRA